LSLGLAELATLSYDALFGWPADANGYLHDVPWQYAIIPYSPAIERLVPRCRYMSFLLYYSGILRHGCRMFTPAVSSKRVHTKLATTTSVNTICTKMIEV